MEPLLPPPSRVMVGVTQRLVTGDEWWRSGISGAEAGLSAGAGESDSNHPNITEMNQMFIEAALITGKIHQSTLSRSLLTCCSMLGVKKDLHLKHSNVHRFLSKITLVSELMSRGQWTLILILYKINHHCVICAALIHIYNSSTSKTSN